MFHQSLIFLIVCLLTGILSRKQQWLSDTAYQKINRWILFITIPAITLEKISQLELQAEFLLPVVASWVFFLVAGLFFAILAYFFRWDRKTWAALTLVCGLGNTSFVGFPVTELLYGDEGLKYAILVDQPGTFAALSTLGIALAAYGSSSGITVKSMIIRLLKFPAFSCFFIALLMPAHIFQNSIIADISYLHVLNYVGSWTYALAFLSIGLQFTFSFQDVGFKEFSLGLFYKLFLGPLLVFTVFQYYQLSGMLYEVTVLGLAMPPMITASIIAIDHGLKPKLSLALINYGMPISAITLYLWSIVL